MILSTTVFLAVPATPILSPGDIQSTSAELSWTQREDDVVYRYEISYRRVGSCSRAPSGNRTIGGHLRQYYLTGLEENIIYNVSIKAFGLLPSGIGIIRLQTLATSKLHH